MFRKLSHVAIALLAVSVTVGLAGDSQAAKKKPWNSPNALKTAPFVGTENHGAYFAAPGIFVGTVANCGSDGHRIVTAAWLRGMGLPNNGSSPTAGPNSGPHTGLLLSKNGPTPDCSAAGAAIRRWHSGHPIFELGFDFRIGGHCGGGAPRFNIYTAQGSYAAGCSALETLTQAPAPQDAQWRRVHLGPDCAGIVPLGATVPFVCNSTPVQAIEIIFDEGTDTTSLPDNAGGVGLAVLDNIRINNQFIRTGSGIVPAP